MIQITNLTKSFPSKLGKQYVFQNLSFTIPTQKNLAILGKNGQGKSTLFRMLARSDYPDRGSIETSLTTSWPISLQTGIHPQMSGRENTRFIGRVNNVGSVRDYETKVQEFAELDDKFDLPVHTYSSGMRARLVFACCLNIPFDIYLIDEATSVGDPIFKQKAKEALKEKSESAGLIMISHDMAQIREFCRAAVVLEDGELIYYDDLEDGIDKYLGRVKKENDK